MSEVGRDGSGSRIERCGLQAMKSVANSPSRRHISRSAENKMRRKGFDECDSPSPQKHA